MLHGCPLLPPPPPPRTGLYQPGPSVTRTRKHTTHELPTLKSLSVFACFAVFYEVVVPLLGVKATALLAISTPKDGFNYYSRLMELKDHLGNKLFWDIQIGLACATCLRFKRACGHFLNLLPQWKPPHLQAKQDAIYGTNPMLRDRETRGIVGGADECLFPVEYVDAFAEREPLPWPAGKPHILYTAIDPSGSGVSDYAMTTCAWIGDTPVVSYAIGLSSRHMKCISYASMSRNTSVTVCWSTHGFHEPRFFLNASNAFST